MVTVAKYLLIGGIVLIVLAGLVYLAARINIPLGRLPGDIRIQTDSVTCLIPLATMILLSVILTILLNIVARLLNR